MPGVDLGKLPVAVMDQHRAESSQHNVGVVGLALLGQYVVEMDFDESQITLYDPASFVPPDGWEEVPLVFEKTLPVLETSLSVDGKTEIPVRLIVDTGGKAALALAIDSAKGLAPPARAVDFLAGTGFRGDVYAPHGRVAKIQVGSEELDDVVGGFWRGAQAPFLAGANANGLLSLGALDHFNLIFDFPHRRMFLKPNGFFSEPFELNMAGMQLEETPSGETVVYYVAENSEAARQGLRKGDRVLSVDGRDVGAYDYRELKQVFENAGSTVSLRIERDGTAKTVSLSLRRIL